MARSAIEIKELLSTVSKRLFTKPNITATGIGYKRTAGKKTSELCIVCSVETKVALTSLRERDIIPRTIDGIPTDVHPTGAIHALSLPTGRFRPAPGGVSIGHVHITAGTLGCLVKSGDKTFILSNNHVLANSNMASPGDMILQPGPFDGGTVERDQIAKLTEFIPIIFENEAGGCIFARVITGAFNFFARITGSGMRLQSINIRSKPNLVDCAIAEPFSEGDVVNEILETVSITGMAEGVLDMEVKKSGRTTGLTTGVIDQTDATVRVNFGAGKTALFTDQLIAGPMSRGGDSGSLVLNNLDEVVGLLFAGSTNTAIINRIQNVFSSLNVTLI